MESIIKWLKKLFTAEEIDIAPTDLSIRVAEIQQRIATLRRSIEEPTKSSYVAQTQPQSMVVTEQPKDSKAAELNDLKAKLLGKKL